MERLHKPHFDATSAVVVTAEGFADFLEDMFDVVAEGTLVRGADLPAAPMEEGRWRAAGSRGAACPARRGTAAILPM